MVALARAGSQLVRVTVNNERGGRGGPGDRAPRRRRRRHRPDRRRLSLQRAPAAREVSRLRRGARQVPDQSRQRRRQAPRRELSHDRAARRRQRQAGSHRRELGLARPGSAHADDGRERARRRRRATRTTSTSKRCSPARCARPSWPKRSGFGHDHIIISAKVSGVQDLVDVYRRLAARCDYPLHLGLTEAGMGTKGIVASTAGLSILLAEGIGDTIRVSLTPQAERRPHRRSARRAADPAVARASQLRAAGHGVSRLRPHDVDVLPAHGARTSRPTFASRCRSGANVARASRS